MRECQSAAEEEELFLRAKEVRLIGVHRYSFQELLEAVQDTVVDIDSAVNERNFPFSVIKPASGKDTVDILLVRAGGREGVNINQLLSLCQKEKCRPADIAEYLTFIAYFPVTAEREEAVFTGSFCDNIPGLPGPHSIRVRRVANEDGERVVLGPSPYGWWPARPQGWSFVVARNKPRE